jgi:transcription elongation factor Elf1
MVHKHQFKKGSKKEQFWGKASSLVLKPVKEVSADADAVEGITSSEDEYQPGSELPDGMTVKPTDESFGVEEILGVKMKRQRAVHYFLRWKGYDLPGWTYAGAMSCDRLVANFMKALKKTPGYKKYVELLKQNPSEPIRKMFLTEMSPRDEAIARGGQSKQKLKQQRENEKRKEWIAVQKRMRKRMLAALKAHKQEQVPEEEMSALSLSPKSAAVSPSPPSPAPSGGSDQTIACEAPVVDLTEDTPCTTVRAKGKDPAPKRAIAQKIAFKCLVCKSELSSKRNLQEHVAIMHSVSPQKFHCEICDNLFKTEKQVKEHQRVHLPPIPCKYCGTHIVKKHMNNHMKTCLGK